METPTTPRSTLNPPVFYTSAALILALVILPSPSGHPVKR